MLFADPRQIIELHRELSHGAAPGPILDKLRQIRHRLTDRLINASTEEILRDWDGHLEQVLRLLVQSPLFSFPLDERETVLADALARKIAEGPSPPSILAAMLYRDAFELPIPVDVNHIPPALLNMFVHYLCSVPQTFAKSGDVDRFADHIRRWANYFLAGLTMGPVSSVVRDGAFLFSSLVNCIPLYFAKDNLRDIHTVRAAILDYMLRLNNSPLDYAFLPRVAGQKIRLGVLRRDFGGLTESYTTLPLFEYLDRSRFEIVLYAQHWPDTASAQRALECADRLVMLEGDVPTQAATIRKDNCDLLLFGTNITAEDSQFLQLACYRLARVHLTNFVSPVTTGMRYMDYYISGRLSEPDHNPQENYTEKLLLLDGPGFCFEYGVDSFPEEPEITRQSLGIPGDAIVFASGANLCKIIPELMNLWASILAQVPNSRLLLFPFGVSWSGSYDNVRFYNIFSAVLARHGVAPNRLIAIRPLPHRGAVRNILKVADIYLDSIRHGGANSLVDPLVLDIPAIVCLGSNLRALQGVGMIRDLGIPELIAADESEYVALAVELARNPVRRRALSEKIGAAMPRPPAFLDPQTHCAQVAKFYESILREKGVLAE